MASETTPLLPRRQNDPPTTVTITTTASPLTWPSITLPALTFLFTLSVPVGIQHSPNWPSLDWNTQDCISRIFLLAAASALSCLINSARKLYARPSEGVTILLVCVYITLDVCLVVFSAATAGRIAQEMDFRQDCPSDSHRGGMCWLRLVDGLVRGGVAAGILIAILHLVFLLRGSILLVRQIITWWRAWRFPFTVQFTVKVSRRDENQTSEETI